LILVFAWLVLSSRCLERSSFAEKKVIYCSFEAIKNYEALRRVKIKKRSESKIWTFSECQYRKVQK